MLRERLGEELLILDGGMGTMLQEMGLNLSKELPETWNITHRETLIGIHQDYIEAGSDIILTNTFGANPLKYKNDEYSVEEIVRTAVENAKEAGRRAGREVYIGLDIGPIGQFIEPYGDLTADEAYDSYFEMISYGVKADVDVIHFETFMDTRELEIAIGAAKKACESRPEILFFATTTFMENGSLLMGGSPKDVVITLERLGVDAVGTNCGLGPAQMLPILEEIKANTKLPIIIKPNAGLPRMVDGKPLYDVEPEEFAVAMQEVVEQGANIIGGCCGTSPRHIKRMVETLNIKENRIK
jgi:5-methyltetrahydrofolate--homocysteine methyltransferase